MEITDDPHKNVLNLKKQRTASLSIGGNRGVNRVGSGRQNSDH
jgi:hypothetical protein